MKLTIRHYLLFLTATVILFSCTGQNQKQDLGIEGYTLVWNDEFEDARQLDSTKWGYETGYVRNNEPQDYRIDNAFCEDGKLVIEARIEEDGTLTSGSVRTKGKAAFTFGKIQACIKIPVGPSAWPAFWTLGQERKWPDQGEIDIMEFYRYCEEDALGYGDPGFVPTILGNAFWVAKDGVEMDADTGTTPISSFTEKDPEWTDKFHVWTMDWDENEIVIRVDDTTINTIDVTQCVNRGGEHAGENPFKMPHYLKLNLALRGTEQDPVVNDSLPMRMEIDWVRVYKKN